jgi:ADP-ribosylglycohydrolase
MVHDAVVVKRTDRIIGSLLGLALGDAFGAPYEGGILERALWFLIGTKRGKRRWTDDTQMTIDVVESLVSRRTVDQEDLARRFAESYRWSRGYGPAMARVLKRIRKGEPWSFAARCVYQEGSFGNGGAMRSPAVGLFFASESEEEVVEAINDVTAVTHPHPLGREGAILIGLATTLTLNDVRPLDVMQRLGGRATSPLFLARIQTAHDWLRKGSTVTPQRLALELGNSVAAVESCVTAVYVALANRERSFDDLLAFVIAIGGDVDTIAAMAGAIWGAARGLAELPQARLERLEQFDHLRGLAHSLATAATDRSTNRRRDTS